MQGAALPSGQQVEALVQPGGNFLCQSIFMRAAASSIARGGDLFLKGSIGSCWAANSPTTPY
jgi:hypothetical protein